MKIKIFLLLNSFILLNSFLNFKFGHKNNFLNREVLIPVEYTEPIFKHNIFNDIDGFYGIIGPDILPKKNNYSENLFDFFNQNGIIQGVFISKGKIFFTKKFIQTEKLLYEQKNGIINFSHFNMLLFELLKYFKLLPNIFGLANTALLNYNNNIYALNERDLPYLLEIDFDKKNIVTKKKINIKFINNFLAHSKIKNNIIETLDYSSFQNKINYCELDSNFNKIRKFLIKKNYNSMVHDFISLNSYIIFIDSPLLLNHNLLLNTSIPLKFEQGMNSYIILFDKLTNSSIQIKINSTFLFHFSEASEDNNYIYIYGCFYDNFNFNKHTTNFAKFRKLIICKKNYTVSIEKNLEIEKYSLDFPIVYKNFTILTHSANLINKFFVVIKNFTIYKIININKEICGEASIIEIKNNSYIICFTKDKKNSYLTICGLNNNYKFSIPINYNITTGFHSLFLSKV